MTSSVWNVLLERVIDPIVWVVIASSFAFAIVLHVVTGFIFRMILSKLEHFGVSDNAAAVPIFLQVSRIILNIMWYVIALVISLGSLGIPYFTWGKLSPVVMNIIEILVIIVVAQILIRIGYYIINKIFAKDSSGDQGKRVMTLRSLLKSIVTYCIGFIAILTILNVLGVNTTSIIATAGVLGLAVGFGAQALVKDMISGFFIIFENQYSVDDHVIINGVEGTVLEVGFRVTKIKGFSGEINIIPNGNITMVTNFCRSNMRAMVDISISYDSDIDKAIEVLTKVVDRYCDENKEKITERVKVLGVQKLGDFSVDIRLLGFTHPLEQWAVERDLRKLSKEALDKAGIRIPFPTHEVYHNGDDGGNS